MKITEENPGLISIRSNYFAETIEKNSEVMVLCIRRNTMKSVSKCKQLPAALDGGAMMIRFADIDRDNWRTQL